MRIALKVRAVAEEGGGSVFSRLVYPPETIPELIIRMTMT